VDPISKGSSILAFIAITYSLLAITTQQTISLGSIIPALRYHVTIYNRRQGRFLEFEDFRAVIMQITVLWQAMPYGYVNINQIHDATFHKSTGI
jgi:ABC-type multidrug transport system fused ATPase/permease subunit